MLFFMIKQLIFGEEEDEGDNMFISEFFVNQIMDYFIVFGEQELEILQFEIWVGLFELRFCLMLILDFDEDFFKYKVLSIYFGEGIFF